MSVRLPLVLADDGLIEQLQSGDTTPESAAVAQILIQNNAIIRLLVAASLEIEVSSFPTDDDVEQFISEISS